MYFKAEQEYIIDKDTIYKYFLRNLMESFRYGKADLIWNRGEYLSMIYGAAYNDMKPDVAKIVCPLAGLYRALYVTKVNPDIALDMLDVYVDEQSENIYRHTHNLLSRIKPVVNSDDTTAEDITDTCNKIGEPELASVAVKVYNIITG